MAYDYSNLGNPEDWYNAFSAYTPAAVPQMYAKEPVAPAAVPQLYSQEPVSAPSLSSTTVPLPAFSSMHISPETFQKITDAAVTSATNPAATGDKPTGIYMDPSTFYISPLSAARDPGLQALYGTGNDPFASLTPEQRAQVTGLENYVASQSGAGGGYYSVGANPYSNLGEIAQKINTTSDPVAQMGYLAQLSMNPAYTQQLAQPYEQNTQYTQNFTTNKNNLAGVVTVGANTPVRLVNNLTGEVASAGTGPQALQQANAVASNLSSTGGGNADWSLQTATPGTSDWVTAARDKPATDVSDVAIKLALDYGLPIAASIALPGIGAGTGNFLTQALGKVGTSALGSALGSAAGSVLQGRSLTDTLTRAALSGAGSYVGGKFLPGLPQTTDAYAAAAGRAAASAVRDAALAEAGGTVLGGAAGSVGGSAAGSALGDVANQILVKGALLNAAGAGAGSALGSGALDLTKALTNAPKSAASGQVDPYQMTVTGQVPATPNVGNIAGSVTPVITNGPAGNQMSVTGQPQTTNVDAGNIAGSTTGNILGEILDPYQINVTARKQVPDLGEVAGALASVGLPAGLAGNAGTTPSTTKSSTTDTLKKAYLGANLLGLLGKALGGGGSGTTSPGGQELQSVFSAKLPTPGEGGAFKVGGLDRVTPQPQDWYRYAMGPSAQVPAGTDLSRATSPYAGYGPGTLGEETFKRVSGVAAAHGGHIGYARGGSNKSFAVEGPGTGRSDDIPAVLSDGEYVIDAETVALLGDGSNRAGAKKLDDMRVKIRKHKGRNLAKGAFSVNAKKPENYLSGGRA